MESTQGTLVKQSHGIGKRSHHSALLKALHIQTVEYSVQRRTLSSFYKLMLYDSPVRDLSVYLMSLYMGNDPAIKGTIISRIAECAISPISAAFKGGKRT